MAIPSWYRDFSRYPDGLAPIYEPSRERPARDRFAGRSLREFAMPISSTLKSSPLTGFDSRAGQQLWFVLLGIVLALCGAFAVLAPLLSTLATTVIVGTAAAIAGVAQVIQAFRAPAWKGFFLNILLGLIYLAASAAFLLSPFIGAIAITMLLAWLLLITGAGEVLLAFRIRPESGWRWLLFSGLVALVGGMWLLLRLPIAGFFIPGVALGIALLFEGFAFMAIGVGKGGRSAPEPAPEKREDPDAGEAAGSTAAD
ncbi:MAG: HdeD family acid-resistance protein [Sphingomonas sp.]|uniref:HdeD family acid-resistance protein n=1 Tax=Sphingomonas sp. TaxID=28214 RepID=UPI0022752A7D|nr:HdeD family acid-resistance protein [Sphingomonas sp.]MCX8474550.1 HdeD family acid-resistance protein [Sphingomonas sp.]